MRKRAISNRLSIAQAMPWRLRTACVFILLLTIFDTSGLKWCSRPSALAQKMDRVNEPEKIESLKYKIIKIWEPKTRNDIRFVYAVIRSDQVKLEYAQAIADQMNEQFLKDNYVRVLFWDDETDAKIFGEKKVDEFSGFNKNLRIVYGLSRKRCVEWVEFVLDKTRPGKKDTVNIRCRSISRKR
ncbi:MAG: hypothetical protein SF339_00040 [Blastocatellia bacterium]|nr:hypothetical protein [Blastocatellia bacterium]